MSSTTRIHPDAVVEALVARATRSNVKRTLRALHDLCQKHYEAGARDFSLSCIGRKAEECGIIGYRSLYNQSSEIYRELVAMWSAYSGPARALPPKAPTRDDYLMKIQDPAIRILVQRVIAERDSLKAQLNLLKGTTLGTIDLRPLGMNISSDPESGPRAVLMLSAQLSERERAALKGAISHQKMKDEGWVEGPQGEISVEGSKRVVFDRGFTSAMRKVLGEMPTNAMDFSG